MPSRAKPPAGARWPREPGEHVVAAPEALYAPITKMCLLARAARGTPEVYRVPRWRPEKSRPTCGEYRSRFAYCPEDGATIRYRADCNDPECPGEGCADAWFRRQAGAICDRLEDAGQAHHAGPVRHFAISLQVDEAKRYLEEYGKAGLLAAFRYVAEEEMGLKGGWLVLHVWRGKNSEWRVSPHAHIYGYGYARPTERVHARTGVFYRMIRRCEARADLERGVFYTLTHAPLIYDAKTERRRCSWSWFGIASSRAMRCGEVEAVAEIQACPVCGGPMLEYHGEPGTYSCPSGRVFWIRRKRQRWRRIDETTQENLHDER